MFGATSNCLFASWYVLGLLARNCTLASGRRPSTFAQALSNVKYNWRSPSPLYKGLQAHCPCPMGHVIMFPNAVQVSGFAF